VRVGGLRDAEEDVAVFDRETVDLGTSSSSSIVATTRSSRPSVPTTMTRHVPPSCVA